MDVKIWPDWFGPDDVADWLASAGLTIECAAGDKEQVWAFLTPKSGIGPGGLRAYIAAHKLGGEWMAYAVAEAYERDAFPADVRDAIAVPYEKGFFGPDAPAEAVAYLRARLTAFTHACVRHSRPAALS